MKTRYETDVVAWANEQTALLRAGRFDQLDLEHIAEELDADDQRAAPPRGAADF